MSVVAATAPPRLPPGPPVEHWLSGHLPRFRRDRLEFFRGVSREHGDVVRVRLGQRIKELREDAGLSQQSLAQAAGGMSRAYVASLELGEKAASIQTLERLAKALKVPISALVDFRGPKPKAMTPEERLASVIAALARGAPDEELEKFEKLARVYFAERRDG